MKLLAAGELNPDLILSNYQFFPARGLEVVVDDLQLKLRSSSAICALQFAWLGNQVAFAGNVGTNLYFAVACGALSTRGLGGTTVQATEHQEEEYIRAQAGR